jgi:hypothetical protein
MAKVQTIEAPHECPECGGQICLESINSGEDGAAILHCRTQHASDACTWRTEVTIAADVERFVIVAKYPEGEVPTDA